MEQKTLTLPKIFIGVGVMPRTRYALNLFLDWYKKQTYPYATLYIFENHNIENAREHRKFVRDAFMSSDCNYLFFADIDTIPPLDALQTLLDAQKDIITGIATSRFSEKDIAVWKGKDDKKSFLNQPDDIIEIDGAGLYCTLAKRDVLNEIKFDWISIIDDLTFFTRAKELGYKAYAHKKVLCKHYYDKNNYYYPQLKK